MNGLRYRATIWLADALTAVAESLLDLAAKLRGGAA